MNKKLRPSAVPLVSVDPYFNIWSFSDNLYDDVTRYWSGRRNSMTLFFKVDGRWYRVMGAVQTDNSRYFTEPERVQQKSCVVEATKTEYQFENDFLKIKLIFRTPLLTDDLYLMSRPVSYITYEVEFLDGKEHDLQVYFDICSEICVDNLKDDVDFGKTEYSIFCGRGEKDVLKNSGDDKLIEWGYLHLIAPGASYRAYTAFDKREIFKWDNRQDGISKKANIGDDAPVLSAWKKFGEVKRANDFLCVAYDDLYSIEYFGDKIEPYWKSEGVSFDDIVKKALEEYEEINFKCDAFDKKMRDEAKKINDKYADLLCLSYRQVIAAHKLVQKNGKLLFFSKECLSNGCVATVDVTYPSIPMFLYMNPKLAEGLLNPIFGYVMENHGWKFEFAPHDIGTYPKANGQVYGYEKEDPEYVLSKQMPIEECGNMILCTAAICKVQNDASYAKDKLSILRQWADYLVKCGYDPENQLCTDDFAGHLAHNCNLSIKAILAIAAFGYILNMLGRDGGEYQKKARQFAEEWESKAFENDHFRLSFDKENTWSLKYNLIWDKFFDFGIFSEETAKTEVAFYKTKLNKYGIPLDCRKEYTKSDWQMWTACLTDDYEYRNSVVEGIWSFVNDTRYRVPFPDWYETETADSHEFQNRTVQGALFMPLLFSENC